MGSAAVKEALKFPLALSSCAKPKSASRLPGSVRRTERNSSLACSCLSRQLVDFAQANLGVHQSGV